MLGLPYYQEVKMIPETEYSNEEIQKCDCGKRRDPDQLIGIHRSESFACRFG
jgi:hypothetical protein